MLMQKTDVTDIAPEGVLTKAVLRASENLGLTNAELADVLGVSTSYISKLRAGASVVALNTKTAEISALVIRAFRSLDAIVGGDTRVAQDWLRNDNTALMGRPIDHMRTIAGLVATVEYLDQRRAPL